MKRYDLRHLKNEFEPRMKELLHSHKKGEVAIFYLKSVILHLFKDQRIGKRVRV